MPNNEKTKTGKPSSGASEREEEIRKILMLWLGRFCAVHQREMTENLASAYTKLLKGCPECVEKGCEEHNYNSPFFPKPYDLKKRIDLIHEIHKDRIFIKNWKREAVGPAPVLTMEKLKRVDPKAFKIINGKRMP